MSARSQRGFTLLELIVVIGIFAIFAAMAYGGLDSVLKTRVHIEQGLARTEEYDRAYLRMRNDFQSAASRGVRGTDGTLAPPFVYDSYTKRVEFTRGGWQNLLNLPRATLERVSYLLDDGTADPNARNAVRRNFDDQRLVRRSWYVLDRAPQTQSVDIVLLDHVKALTFRFLDDSSTWQESWATGNNGSFGDPNANAALPSPRAIEIKLTTKDWGDLKFLFAVGAEGSNQEAKLLATPQTPANPSTTPPPPPIQPPAE
jgi:general secretion pathway protein J